jgi:galactitol-specific phosphotransferase system IIB component
VISKTTKNWEKKGQKFRLETRHSSQKLLKNCFKIDLNIFITIHLSLTIQKWYSQDETKILEKKNKLQFNVQHKLSNDFICLLKEQNDKTQNKKETLTQIRKKIEIRLDKWNLTTQINCTNINNFKLTMRELKYLIYFISDKTKSTLEERNVHCSIITKSNLLTKWKNTKLNRSKNTTNSTTNKQQIYTVTWNVLVRRSTQFSISQPKLVKQISTCRLHIFLKSLKCLKSVKSWFVDLLSFNNWNLKIYQSNKSENVKVFRLTSW